MLLLVEKHDQEEREQVRKADLRTLDGGPPAQQQLQSYEPAATFMHSSISFRTKAPLCWNGSCSMSSLGV